MEDYLNATKSLNCMSIVEVDDEKYLCFCRFDIDEYEIIITCTNIHTDIWQERLTYDDMKFRKREQKLLNEGWDIYMGRIRKAFEQQNLFLDFSHKKQQNGIMLTTVNNNESICYHFLLKESRSPKQDIPNLMFNLLSDYPRLLKLEGECENLKFRLKKQQMVISEMPSSLSAPTIETIPLKVRSPIKKVSSRKPGFSLVNPQVKRRQPTTKGAKIEFDKL